MQWFWGLFLFLIFITSACSPNKKEDFQKWLSQSSKDSTLIQEPLVHKPNTLPLVAAAHLKTQLALKEKRLAELLRIDTSGFSAADKTSWLQARHRLEAELSKLRPYRYDPSVYDLSIHIQPILAAADSLPLAQRLDLIEGLLADAPAYFAAAQAALYQTQAKKTLLASQKQLRTLQLLHGALQDSLSKAQLSPEKQKSFSQALTKTEKAVKDYLAFCNETYFIPRKEK